MSGPLQIPTPEPVTFDAIGRIRMMPVTDNRNAPDVALGDYVAVLPADGFRFDGLHVLESLGVPALYRCMSWGSGNIRVFSSDPREVPYVIPHETFRRSVVGVVVMKCKVLSHAAIEEALGGAQ